MRKWRKGWHVFIMEKAWGLWGIKASILLWRATKLCTSPFGLGYRLFASGKIYGM